MAAGQWEGFEREIKFSRPGTLTSRRSDDFQPEMAADVNAGSVDSTHASRSSLDSREPIDNTYLLSEDSLRSDTILGPVLGVEALFFVLRIFAM
jgi:hypothetical protein